MSSVTLVLAAVGAAALLLILELQRRELGDLRRRCTEIERRVSTLAVRAGVNTAEDPVDPYDPGRPV